MPQGSNSGPLLWNAFQNDLSITLTRAASKMYADDHQMYVAGEKMEEMERTLTDEGE